MKTQQASRRARWAAGLFLPVAVLAAGAAPAPPVLTLKVTPGPVLEHTRAVHSVAFSPDGRSVATGCDDGVGRVWDVRTGKPITPPMKDTFPVRLLSFRPDGKAVVVGAGPHAGPGRMRVHDAVLGRPLTPLMMDVADAASGSLWDLAFSPDGKLLLASCGHDGARLYDAGTGRQVGATLADSFRSKPVAFHPGGKLAAAGRGAGRLLERGEVRFWDVQTGKQVGPVMEHAGEVHALAFSADGQLLVTGSEYGAHYQSVTGKPHSGGTIRLFDAQGKPVGKTFESYQQVRHVAFRPDGKEVLALTGKTLRHQSATTWDVATGKRRFVLESSVKRAVWSPDGKWVVTAGERVPPLEDDLRGQVRIWDAQTGKPLADRIEHPQEVLAVAISPDGRRLVTGCLDGKARLWTIELVRKPG